MDFLERLTAVLHGERPDRVPYAPYDNLVPRGDFERELRNRGMGLCLRRQAVWSEVPDVGMEHGTEGEVEYTVYHTLVGSVRTGHLAHVGRIADGEALPHEWPIKGVEDYEPVIFMVENTVFHTDYEGFLAHVRDVGRDGIVRLEGPIPPYDQVRYDMGFGYLSLQGFAVEEVDHPEQMARLLEALRRRTERVMPLVLEGPGEFISLGDVDGLYGTRQYEEHVLPFYDKYRSQLQEAGKIWSVHAHNSNLSVYGEVVGRTGAPVIEAFTPPPVGDLSLAAAREAWGKETVIWVNFPETIFWHGKQATYDYTVNLLKEDQNSGRLVIGMTEMGSYGITDDKNEHVFKEGMRAMMDAIDDHGVY